MPVHPGSNYIGPGNSLDSGVPTNSIGLNALIHDTEYSNAKSANDIREADERFLIANYNTIPRSGLESFHKYVSIAGIGIKYGVESITGIIYPSLQVWVNERLRIIWLKG